MMRSVRSLSVAGGLVLCGALHVVAAESWVRHTVDDSSRGADGVRLADVNSDGWPDVVTGWEEGGVIRIYRHPGPEAVNTHWPSVTVGRVNSPEDAVFVDLDGNGLVDVVSCCEGRTRRVFAHYAPEQEERYWDADAWTTTALTDDAGRQMWMFCTPLESPDPSLSLIIGSKGNNGSISRLVHAGSRESSALPLKRLCDAGWIMSLRRVDMDGDGDDDVLFSDRKGSSRGLGWLEQPGDPDRGPWPLRMIGGTGQEVMFLDFADLDADGENEVVAATRSSGILICRRSAAKDSWQTRTVPMPRNTGTGKAVRVADVDQDGRADLVVSCEQAVGLHGVFWMSSDATADRWTMRPISGNVHGVKFDRMEVLDLDDDGDLDVMTCEERDNLGVIWYENPQH